MKKSIALASLSDPTQTLTDLRQQEREIIGRLEGAKHRYSITRSDLEDARNLAAGLERRTHPHDQQTYREAKARVAELQQRFQSVTTEISALERDLTQTRTAVSALFNGPTGYQNALALFNQAKAKADAADQAVHAFSGRQASAAQALAHARNAQEKATQDQQAALDAAALSRARIARDQAQRELGDAETLQANLKRHAAKLQAAQQTALAGLEDARKRVFSAQAEQLTDRFKQQARDLALEAFAAARLAGSGWSFREFVADALDPAHEFIPSAVEAYQAQQQAALDAAVLEKISHD